MENPMNRSYSHPGETELIRGKITSRLHRRKADDKGGAIVQKGERFLKGKASNQPQKQSQDQRDCLESAATPKTTELTYRAW